MQLTEKYATNADQAPSDDQLNHFTFQELSILFLGDESIASGEKFMELLCKQYEEKLGIEDLTQSKRQNWELRLKYLNQCTFGQYVHEIKGWVSQVLAYACLRPGIEERDRERKFAELDPSFPDHDNYLRAKGITSANCNTFELEIREDTYALGAYVREVAPTPLRRIGSYLTSMFTI